jgi:hypothetical protein
MYPYPVRFAALITLPTARAGLIAALVTLSAHDADPVFIYEQQHPMRIAPTQLESILIRTREPVPAGRGNVASGSAVFQVETGLGTTTCSGPGATA